MTARWTRPRSPPTSGSGGMAMLEHVLTAGLLLLSAGPQLEVRDVSVARSGERLQVTSTVANAGAQRSRASRIEYRVAGRVAATRRLRPLAPDASARGTVRLTR